MTTDTHRNNDDAESKRLAETVDKLIGNNDDTDSKRLAEAVDKLMIMIGIMSQLGNLAAAKAETQQQSILEGDIWDDIEEEPCILLPGNTVIKNPELLSRLTNEVF